LDVTKRLRWDTSRQELRGGERVKTHSVPHSGERRTCDTDDDGSDDDDTSGRPTGFSWLNVEELFESLSGHLLCTQCGMADLTAQPPDEQHRASRPEFRFWCDECDDYTFTLHT
jgi:hypothetical protein